MNYLFISVDSLRADFAPPCPDGQLTAPFLSKLAKESAVFSNAISPSTWTLPVHTSIFTGLYPPEHGVYDIGDSLGSVDTLAEHLHGRGYDTASFAGNGWLNTGNLLRGFNHHHISPPLSKYWFKATINGVKQSEVSMVARGISNIAKIPYDLIARYALRDNHHDKRIVNAYCDFLQESADPFFHFVHLNGAHNPYRPHLDHYREFGDAPASELRDAIGYQKQLIKDRPQLAADLASVDQNYLDEIANLYQGAIHQTDVRIREIVEALQQHDLYEDTVIVVFGDHGDHLGENDLWGHQFSVADEVIRVPLVIKDPSGRFGESQRDDVVQLNDLYPSILEMTSSPVPERHSYDISEPNRDTAFVYYSTPESHLERVRREQDLDPNELPPQEQFAARDSSERRVTWYPDTDEWVGESELLERLKNHHAAIERTDDGTTQEVSDEIKQNLRDMGYI